MFILLALLPLAFADSALERCRAPIAGLMDQKKINEAIALRDKCDRISRDGPILSDGKLLGKLSAQEIQARLAAAKKSCKGEQAATLKVLLANYERWTKLQSEAEADFTRLVGPEDAPDDARRPRWLGMELARYVGNDTSSQFSIEKARCKSLSPRLDSRSRALKEAFASSNFDSMAKDLNQDYQLIEQACTGYPDAKTQSAEEAKIRGFGVQIGAIPEDREKYGAPFDKPSDVPAKSVKAALAWNRYLIFNWNDLQYQLRDSALLAADRCLPGIKPGGHKSKIEEGSSTSSR
jgi:hypothetical protein